MNTKRCLIEVLSLIILCLAFPNMTVAATLVSGNIDKDTTWTIAESPYVVGGLIGSSILPGVTLTIEPGVVIKFSGIVSLGVSGTLLAQGTASEPIIFTSYRDDSAAGDTNGDGSGTVPQAGDWNRINFYSGCTANLNHVAIRYGRYPAYIYSDAVTIGNSRIEDHFYGGIQIDGASPTIDRNIIQRNPTGVFAADSSFTLTNNEIMDNTGFAVSLDNSSNSIVSGNTISGNGVNGIGVENYAQIAVDTTWSSKDAAYLVGNISILPGVTLTIEPGVVIKFSGIVSLGVSGTLLAQGTASEPIIFTSYHDDTAAGDTNGDGSGTVPQAGDWNRINFYSGCTANLNHVAIRYGRYPAYIYSDAVTIGNSRIEDHFYGGIQIDGASPTIESSIIRNSVIGVSAKNPTIVPILLKNNLIYENTSIGISMLAGADTFSMLNNTITANGNGIHVVDGTNGLIQNNIIVNNSQFGITSALTPGPEITYNNVWGNAGGDYDGCTPGIGNLSADPLFADVALYDLALLPGSPCIDAASSEGAPLADFEGKPRYDDPDTSPNTGGGSFDYFDMGALEYNPICGGDFEPDGDVDGFDLLVLMADFGRTNCADDCPGNLDGDNDVDSEDLSIIVKDFGRMGCPVLP